VIERALLVLAILFFSLVSHADQNQNYPFSIETENEGDGHRIVAHNNGPAPISVKVSITDSQNITPDRPLPIYAVVPPGGGTLYLAHIRPAIAGTGYTFRTQSSWILGDFNARQSPDAIYRLPYQDGMTFRIGQAFGGPITTHTAPDSQHAVDIGMPQGTPIVAARDGVVIYTEANQIYGGQSPDMMTKANEVRIQHIDGTIAIYAHLAYGGVYVYPGQKVVAGTQIGLAGSTGYSSGPHLHFAVQTVEQTGNGLTMVSLPFQFYVGNPAVAFSPQFGMIATADYASVGHVPTTEEPVQVAAQTQPTTRSAVALGNPETVVSIEIPTIVHSFLNGTPTSILVGGLAIVILLFILLGKARQAKQRQNWWVVQEPTIQSSTQDQVFKHGLSSRDKLILACGGDRQRADRLEEYEHQRAQGLSAEQAAQRAWERLQWDRR
jgi:murein DD-endopeptidase MepM/ murein hydrolase activator NlpD